MLKIISALANVYENITRSQHIQNKYLKIPSQESDKICHIQFPNTIFDVSFGPWVINRMSICLYIFMHLTQPKCMKNSKNGQRLQGNFPWSLLLKYNTERRCKKKFPKILDICLLIRKCLKVWSRVIFKEKFSQRLEFTYNGKKRSTEGNFSNNLTYFYMYKYKCKL